MATFRVVLVEPKSEGNIGAVARAMRNFGIEDLVLVNPVPIRAEARQRAMHGAGILDRARAVEDFESAVAGAALLVGTSGIDTKNEKRFARIALSPRELATKIQRAKGQVALVFGREDFGLLDEELRRCDVLVKIPAAEPYPILNLSHAVAIVLYELFAAGAPRLAVREMSGVEKQKLHASFVGLLDVTDYPVHKRSRTQIMFRRLLGRAVPSKWECHALLGVLERATKRIRRLEDEP
jgi:TrmH family RNA methyltransferase